jgi:hypothetical protein
MAEVERKYAIGIDPGVTTGFAMYDRRLKVISVVKTLDFWSCYEHLKATKPTCDMFIVVVECPVKTAMYARQEPNAAKGNARYGNRMMSNAAGNAREAELLADGIEKLGFEVRRVRPAREKWNQERLERVTGYTERTNQHVRDAIQMCWEV